jgi:hypothetical protein
MRRSSLKINTGVSIEIVGSEALVAVPESPEIIRVSGAAAEVIVGVLRGDNVSHANPAVADLIERGILTSSSPSRRSVLTAGAAGLGVGITMVSLPGVAAAASAITVLGDYYVYDGNDNNRYLQARVPGDRGVAVDFPEGLGNPSALSVPGLPDIPLVPTSVRTQYDLSADLSSGTAFDWALWEISVTANPALVTIYGAHGSQIPATGDTLNATFTWGTLSYRASLTYFVPPNR